MPCNLYFIIVFRPMKGVNEENYEKGNRHTAAPFSKYESYFFTGILVSTCISPRLLTVWEYAPGTPKMMPASL